MKRNLDESELFAEAWKAYVDYHEEEGNLYYDSPSRLLTEINKRYVKLCNGRGLLARYNYHQRKLIIKQ